MTFAQPILLRTDGSFEALASTPHHDSIRELIEAASLSTVNLWKHGATMYLDDLGFQLKLPVNRRATQLYLEHCRPGVDWAIRGHVLIVPDQKEAM